jgi:DNA mismatch repair protein MutS
VGILSLNSENSRIESLARQFEGSDKLLGLLQTWVMENPRTNIKDGNVINLGVDDELDECRALLTNADEVLRKIETKEREATGISTLRVEYNKLSGYVIEVTKSQTAKVPIHYQRKQTLKNVERYTTAELRDFEQKALTAQDRALKRERILYEQLLEKMMSHVPWLQSMSFALSQLDILTTFAKQANQWNYVQPTLDSTSSYIQYQQGRHPVVERHLAGTYQPNDIAIGSEHPRTWVITGPNMGGKSTFMRQTALIALMAYIGCPVPANACALGNLDAILTRIGASDDVAGGRSTFMVEMEETASILEHATTKTLALMDELGRGTSAKEGRAIAQATLERIHRRNRSLTLFSTHYQEIAAVADHDKSMLNVRAQTVEHPGDIEFTHCMEKGVASHSYGIHVAQRANVPDDVLARAYQLVNDQTVTSPAASLEIDLSMVDLDNMTPREAWDFLHRLKQGTK